jgi:2-polyprenyl-3-methyl-5-hydroxy-6-metoxy-1,4-benzoquinol methylase
MASDDYRAELFDRYSQRVEKLDPDRQSKVAWFREYIGENYSSQLSHADPTSAKVLDVGCSGGYLVQALAELGWKNLIGIDLSPGDVEAASVAVPQATFVHASALDYLAAQRSTFDVVIARAVLEHTPKVEVMPVLSSMAAALRPGGLAIIDVPNMDWLFAGHERYMDFTHEVGFTRESLAQVMEGLFEVVDVRAVDHRTAHDRATFRSRLGRRLMSRLLEWADPQGAGNPIWHRNLVAFGRLRRG